MNAQKFTQKSLRAIRTIYCENNNIQIEQEHLVAALLQQDNGLIPQLLKENECGSAVLLQQVEQENCQMRCNRQGQGSWKDLCGGRCGPGTDRRPKRRTA